MQDIERYHLWRTTTIAQLGGKCAFCGVTDNLEFDHVDESTKLFSLSKNWGIADKDVLAAEVKKCQLLCSPCHKKKTSEFQRQRMLAIGFTHGTMYGWMKRKCGCELCETAKTRHYTERRKNKTSSYTRGPYQERGIHGASRYKRGCRCAVCRDAHNKKAREYRNKQK